MVEATNSPVVLAVEESVLQLEIDPLSNCVENMVIQLHPIAIDLMRTSCLKVPLILVPTQQGALIPVKKTLKLPPNDLKLWL